MVHSHLIEQASACRQTLSRAVVDAIHEMETASNPDFSIIFDTERGNYKIWKDRTTKYHCTSGCQHLIAEDLFMSNRDYIRLGFDDCILNLDYLEVKTVKTCLDGPPTVLYRHADARQSLANRIKGLLDQKAGFDIVMSDDDIALTYSLHHNETWSLDIVLSTSTIHLDSEVLTLIPESQGIIALCLGPGDRTEATILIYLDDIDSIEAEEGTA